jgi:hypothetical protein
MPILQNPYYPGQSAESDPRMAGNRIVGGGAEGAGKDLTRDQLNAMSMSVYNKVNETDVGVSAWQHVGNYAAATSIDLADSVWGSPLNPLGERGDLWANAPTETQEYYARHKGLIEGSSAVVGGVMTVVAAEALVIPKMTSALMGSTALRGSKLVQMAEGWNISSRTNMLAAQRAAAEAGEAYGLVNNSAGRMYLANRAAAGVAGATRTIPLEYGIMGNNEAFNSGDWANEGFWIGAATLAGGAVGAIGARAVVRRSANSAEVRAIRSAPFAMAGVSNTFLSPDYMKQVPKLDANKVQLKESASFTELMLASRSANPSGYAEAAKNASALSQDRAGYRSLAIDSMQKMVMTGIEGVSTVKGPLAKIPEARYLVDEVGKKDPFLLHGVAELGVIETGVKKVRADRLERIELIRKQADLMGKQGKVYEAMRLNYLQGVLKRRQEAVLINGSWFNPDDSFAKEVLDFNQGAAQKKIHKSSETAPDQVTITLPIKGRVRLDASLTPQDASGRFDVAKLAIKDRLTLDEGAIKLVSKLGRKDSKVGFKLTDEAAKSWYTLDLAAEILDKGGKVEFSTKALKIENIEELRRESLRLKAKAALTELGPLGRATPELRFRYNLPAPTALEQMEDAAGDGFRAWLQVAAKDEGTLRELAQGLSDSRVVQGIDLLPAGDAPYIRTDGEMLKFNRNQDSQFMRPSFAYFDPKNQMETISQRGHANAMTLKKAEKTAVLVGSKTHVSALANLLMAMPELQKAMNVAGLAADQITGLGGSIGQALGEALPKRFRFRDNETLLAATKVHEAAEKHGLAVFRQMMDSVGMQDIVTQTTSAGHAATRTQLDQYMSLRAGWDVDDVIPTKNGMHEFVLKDTAANRKRLGIDENAKWNKFTTMPNERLKIPIAVNDEALKAIRAYNALTDAMREADNTLRAAKGLAPIEFRPWYVPPPNTKGALVGFVFDQSNKPVPGMTIVARSQEEYHKLYRRTLDDLGEGFTIRDKDQLEDLRDIWDEAGMDWMDPGISAANAGIGGQTGGLTGQFIKQGAFSESLDWVKRKAIVQSQDTVKQMLEESLLVARVRGSTEAVVNAQKGQRSIYDEYEQAITGNSKAYADSSLVDGALKKVEARINNMLAHSAVVNVGRHIVDLAQRIGMDPTDLNGAKTYKQIAEKMGDYTPFRTATEFTESRGIKRPPTVKGMAQTMNTMAASVLLRYFELPHAMMNGLGLIATLPATVMSGRAPISTFTDVKGKKVGFIDGTKIMSDAMKDMFTRKGSKDFKRMVANGDASQSVMEYHEAIGAIQSQAGFMKAAKNFDKYASILSDTSENWSRQFSHFVGLRLADYHGIADDVARHNFAREIANAMIADYAPINRPELFGSGFGSMVGLFQSYALNHYTKMFRWMENGEYAKVGLQAGMQATMFGVGGTYGIGQLLDLRDSTVATGSEPTATDLVYEKFGPVLGGAIMNGSISQVTQLAMWTRGDTNFRIPGANGTLAPLEIGTKVARGFADAIGAYMSAQPGEGGHALMEIVQREMPNRIMKSWLVLLNDGKEVDAYGQVMSETKTWMDTVARVVGVRSRRQQSELDAYYAGKGALERDAGAMEQLRLNFRAAVRNNKGRVEDINPVQYFNDYVKAGGNPKLFKTFIKNNLRDSNDSRAVKVLNQQMSTPRAALESWRFHAYGATGVDQ